MRTLNKRGSLLHCIVWVAIVYGTRQQPNRTNISNGTSLKTWASRSSRKVFRSYRPSAPMSKHLLASKSSIDTTRQSQYNSNTLNSTVSLDDRRDRKRSDRIPGLSASDSQSIDDELTFRGSRGTFDDDDSVSDITIDGSETDASGHNVYSSGTVSSRASTDTSRSDGTQSVTSENSQDTDTNTTVSYGSNASPDADSCVSSISVAFSTENNCLVYTCLVLVGACALVVAIIATVYVLECRNHDNRNTSSSQGIYNKTFNDLDKDSPWRDGIPQWAGKWDGAAPTKPITKNLSHTKPVNSAQALAQSVALNLFVNPQTAAPLQHKLSILRSSRPDILQRSTSSTPTLRSASSYVPRDITAGLQRPMKVHIPRPPPSTSSVETSKLSQLREYPPTRRREPQEVKDFENFLTENPDLMSNLRTVQKVFGRLNTNGV